MLIDGGGGRQPISRAEARTQLDQLEAGSPFLDLTGLGLPWSLVDRHETYDHVDPLSAAAPGNAFVRTVVPFLRRVE